MHRGFTLIELMTVLALSAVLIALGLPSYSASLRKARRADAVVQLALLQQRQENWRADHAGYGSSEDLGLTADARDSNYSLSITSAGPASYVATAEARGAQLGDEPCRVMRLSLSGSDSVRASGPDAAVGNDTLANSRCWLQ